MKRNVFFWATCTVLLFIISLSAYQIIAHNTRIDRENIGNFEKLIIKFRLIVALFVFTAIIAFFHKNTPITKGIVLGVLVAWIIYFSHYNGIFFDIRMLPRYRNLGTQIVIIPVLSFVLSVIFFTKRNFDLAKVFAFVTVSIFAAFFLAQLVKTLFLDSGED